MADSHYSITFVGAGRMASAMIRSLLRNQSFLPDQIACCSADDGTSEQLVAETGIHRIDIEGKQPFTTESLVVACKPQQISSISPVLVKSAAGSLLISILAGTKIETLNRKFPGVRNVVRVMPNTPGSIGEGMSGFAPAGELSRPDRQTVETVLRSLGKFIEVEEAQMDAVTAISGSGPAYLFLFVEALTEAAVNQGFDEKTARLLAQQTVVGSAKLLEQSAMTPEALRIQVTSPGGTTQAALESFEASGFRAVVDRAARAAADRSVELGNS